MTGEVKLLPDAKATPPVAAANQFMVAAVLGVAFNVTAPSPQTDPGVVETTLFAKVT